MGVQLTPGQRFLLDLLQRKLLSTIESYARLSSESQKLSASRCSETEQESIDEELQRLREKIKRISARQKRFTSEIINGNGNNTIPKESFFEALGLVTRDTLNKLNSKSNERRRRTTANPRFSHQAIQAKRALEPIQKRIEPKEPKIPASRNKSLLNDQERRELMEQFTLLQKQINMKITQIHNKRENNRKLEEQNESVKRRGLDMVNAIHKIYMNGRFRDDDVGLQGALEHGNASSQDNNNQILLPEPYDILLKCDESLDGLD